MNDTLPSQVINHPWIYAHNRADKRTVYPNLTGKFMLFINKNKLDEKWKIVKEATEKGFFSYNSKCSTAMANPKAINDHQGVICIYTVDYNDMDEINRVEKNIRSVLGYSGTLYYKLDNQTAMEKFDHGKPEFAYYYKFEQNNYSGVIKYVVGGLFCIAAGYIAYKIKNSN